MNPNDRILYDIPTLIELTGLGRTLIYQEMRDGRLKAIKVGRRTLFEPEEVKNWISQQKQYQTEER